MNHSFKNNFYKEIDVDLSEFNKRSNLLSAIFFVFTISLIFFFVLACSKTHNIPLYIVSFIMIGALQHRLSIFLHEAIHFTLFDNKRLNRFVGSLSAYMIFFKWNYRKIHLKHHKHLGDDHDPDLINYVNYPSGLNFFLLDVISNFSGISACKQFIKQSLTKKPQPNSSEIHYSEIFLLLVTQTLIFILFYLSGYWLNYFILWILPLITVAKSLAHFRNVAEHVLIENGNNPELERLRTIKSNILERFFFAPLAFNYHAEHHMFPGVPFHRLSSLSKTVREQSFYKENIHFYPFSYCRLLLNHALCRKS